MCRGTISDGSATMPSGNSGKSRSIASISEESTSEGEIAAGVGPASISSDGWRALPHGGNAIRGDQARAPVGRIHLLVEPRAAAGRGRQQEVHQPAADADDLVWQVQ